LRHLVVEDFHPIGLRVYVNYLPGLRILAAEGGGDMPRQRPGGSLGQPVA
jgi:hypothetical protein